MVNYNKCAHKLMLPPEIHSPVRSKRQSILSSFFSNKNIVNPIVKAKKCISYDIQTPLHSIVYIHYGPICLKKSILFFPDFVNYKNKYYSLNNARYNDNLFEIYLKKLTIRIDDSDIYNYIKNYYIMNINSHLCLASFSADI